MAQNIAVQDEDISFLQCRKKCVSVFHFMCSLWHIIIMRKQMPLDYFTLVFEFIYTHEPEVVQLGAELLPVKLGK